MKAIIVSVLSAMIAVIGLGAPANATGNGGMYLAGNSGFSSSGWSRIGMKDGKFYIEGETVTCHKMNAAMGMNFNTGSTQVNMPQANVPSADTTNCNTGQVITNPPANSTITINGVCGDPAEIAKIKAANANLIINSVGPCPTDGRKPATPATIIVTQKEAAAKTASATNNGPVTLPETGLSDITLLSGGLAVLAYSATLAFRAFRARA